MWKWEIENRKSSSFGLSSFGLSAFSDLKNSWLGLDTEVNTRFFLCARSVLLAVFEMVLLIQLFSFFLCFQNVMSFAAWFVTDDLICERPLKVGEIVMNYPIVEDDAKLAIEVYGMDGEVLKSGVIGKAGAKYSVVVVHIDDRPQAKAKGEFILDASEGIFMEEDHCGNKRSLLREAEITVPNQQVDPIEITAGYVAVCALSC